MTLTTKFAPCMAEVLFLNPDNVNAGIAALEQHGFTTEILTWIDPFGPTIWVHAFISTDDEAGLLDLVQGIVGRLGGDVVEAGLAVNRSHLLRTLLAVRCETPSCSGTSQTSTSSWLTSTSRTLHPCCVASADT